MDQREWKFHFSGWSVYLLILGFPAVFVSIGILIGFHMAKAG